MGVHLEALRSNDLRQTVTYLHRPFAACDEHETFLRASPYVYHPLIMLFVDSVYVVMSSLVLIAMVLNT